MTLSDQTVEALRDAQHDLREALAFASRTEKTYVLKHIAQMANDIDNLIDVTKLLEKAGLADAIE